MIRSGREIPLTPRENTLLESLACNEGRALSRVCAGASPSPRTSGGLGTPVWNDDDSYSNTIAARIRQLRQKVDFRNTAGRLIRTV